jgi:hypothetical protein
MRESFSWIVPGLSFQLRQRFISNRFVPAACAPLRHRFQLRRFVASDRRQTLNYLTLFVRQFCPAFDRSFAATATSIIVIHFTLLHY